MKLAEYLQESSGWEIEYLKKLKFKDTDELVKILNSRMNESRKSQFVAKLIGLGILVKDEKTGRLISVKNISKEEVINMLHDSE
jgi:hypothetical protein